MKNKIGLLLAVCLAVNVVSTIAYGIPNPLRSYDLYKDTHPDEDTIGSKKVLKNPKIESYDLKGAPSSSTETVEKTRNQILRESSRNVYSDPNTKPGWEEGPSYYPNPTFNSIVEKYRMSDFAGCLQECTSYVRRYPNDTLGFYYLAMCYTKVSDTENAIKAYERVIALNDNPMIVKYATNGRNCIMNNENEKCYPNVNVAELLHPYKDMPKLTPLNPEELVQTNWENLRDSLAEEVVNITGDDKSKDAVKKAVDNLPFGKQDSELDKFINAPYGNGLSPQLNNEYKQLQLKKIQSTINAGENSPAKSREQMKYIKEFDKQKSDLGTIKLAYDVPKNQFEELSKDPEYVKMKQEYDELRMMLGASNSNSDKNSDSDIYSYMSDLESKKISPEALQTMMMNSMMGDFTF